MLALQCISMENAMEELRVKSMKLCLRVIMRISVSGIKHIRNVTNLNMIIAQEKTGLKVSTHSNQKQQKKVSIKQLESWAYHILGNTTFHCIFLKLSVYFIHQIQQLQSHQRLKPQLMAVSTT